MSSCSKSLSITPDQQHNAVAILAQAILAQAPPRGEEEGGTATIKDVSEFNVGWNDSTWEKKALHVVVLEPGASRGGACGEEDAAWPGVAGNARMIAAGEATSEGPSDAGAERRPGTGDPAEPSEKSDVWARYHENKVPRKCFFS